MTPDQERILLYVLTLSAIVVFLYLAVFGID